MTGQLLSCMGNIYVLPFLGYFFIGIGCLALMLCSRQRSLFFVLIYLELLLLGISLLFLNAALAMGDGKGYLIVLVILVSAVVETSVGLAPFIRYYYTYGNLSSLAKIKYLRRKQG